MKLRRAVALSQMMVLAVALSACEANAPPAASVSPPKMQSWNAMIDGDPKTYTIDGYTLTFSSREMQGDKVPALHVKAPSGEETDITGFGGFPNISADFGVGRLDTLGLTEEVIFSTFSGGAHCCTSVQVLKLVDGRWKTIDLGQWDGGGLGSFPTDIDGDGYADMVFSDDRFAYAFTNYAESRMPPRVFEIRNGAAQDVSASGRYRPLYEEDMKEAQRDCAMHNNGACAAFVADAAHLGLFGRAWEEMLTNYDAKSDWDYPTKCNVVTADGQCPKDEVQKFTNFPDALAWFLAETGYTKPRP